MSKATQKNWFRSWSWDFLPLYPATSNYIILLHPLGSYKLYASFRKACDQPLAHCMYMKNNFEKLVQEVSFFIFLSFPSQTICASAPKRHFYFKPCDLAFLGFRSVIRKMEIQCWKTNFISVWITCFLSASQSYQVIQNRFILLKSGTNIQTWLWI